LQLAVHTASQQNEEKRALVGDIEGSTFVAVMPIKA
jgi:hypothetical protein